MGLFDQVAGAVGALGGQSGTSAIDVVLQIVNNPQTGGLAGLVQKLQSGGLSEIVNSWVSTGQNLPISAEQLSGVLGSEQIQNIASQLGIPREQALGQLADLLPKVIDGLTPSGALPEGGDLLAQGVSLLKGKLFG